VPATWESEPARSDVTGNTILTSIHGHCAERYKTFQFLGCTGEMTAPCHEVLVCTVLWAGIKL